MTLKLNCVPKFIPCPSNWISITLSLILLANGKKKGSPRQRISTWKGSRWEARKYKIPYGDNHNAISILYW